MRGAMDCPCPQPLLPGLPADLASLCLAKLPIDSAARSRSVSHAWASALSSYPAVGRSPLGLAACLRCKEDDDNSMTWLFLSRSDLRSFVIPFKPQIAATFTYPFGLQVIRTGTALILVRTGVKFMDYCKPCVSEDSDCRGVTVDEDGAHGPGFLQGFDVWQMKWCNIPCRPMPVDRWKFATAHFGKHVYFAGGVGLSAASTAERLCLDTWTWETLPPMHKKRMDPSGFALSGRFFVVGGESDMVSSTLSQSGEFYDPSMNAWTLVPDMWPHDLWWACGCPQIVVVLNDVAYTIDHKLQAVVQLKMDNPSLTNMKWQVVGQLPWSKLDRKWTSTMPCLFSVHNELWAVLNTRNHDSVFFACKPHLTDHELHWERLPFIIAPSTRSTLTLGADVTT